VTQYFNWYCKCGAHWNGNQHPNAVAYLRRQWDEIHAEGTTDKYGDTHGKADRNTCRRARAKAESQAQNDQAHLRVGGKET